MNEAEARQMIKEIDAARLTLNQVTALKEVKSKLTLGTVSHMNHNYSAIHGIIIPKDISDYILAKLEIDAKSVLFKYDVKP